MEVAIRVCRTPAGFQAWTPELPGCAASGASESEAIDHLRHAIEGRLAMEALGEETDAAEEMRVRVETVADKRAKAARLAAIEPEPATVIPPYFQFAIGGALFGLGLTGIFSFILVTPTTTPVLFFASAVVAAMGAGGILMGLITLESARTARR
jgi:predicted RNase H-like HicB family nuclease